jgi:hypothetical protein
MAIPLINGEAYGWADIKINILGREVIGVKSVSYSDTQEKQNNYGAGHRPVSRGRGRIEAEASVTLHMEEVIALQAIAPQRNIMNIRPFDIIVSYINSSGAVVTDKIRNCEFLSNSRDISEGDMEIPVELELIISHIDYN